MSKLLVNKETGEVKVSPFSVFMHESIGLNTGTMIIQNYEFAWDDATRDFKIVEGSKEDRQAYIDSFAEECGVYNILKKYSITGDVSVFNRSQGFYGDISELPVDELNPDAVAKKAQAAVSNLSGQLGIELTSEKLASMSLDEINQLIEKAVIAKTQKQSEKKEGDE